MLGQKGTFDSERNPICKTESHQIQDTCFGLKLQCARNLFACRLGYGLEHAAARLLPTPLHFFRKAGQRQELLFDLGGADKRAFPHPTVNQTLLGKSNQGLANRHAAYAELVDQLSLGGQTLMFRIRPLSICARNAVSTAGTTEQDDRVAERLADLNEAA